VFFRVHYCQEHTQFCFDCEGYNYKRKIFPNLAKEEHCKNCENIEAKCSSRMLSISASRVRAINSIFSCSATSLPLFNMYIIWELRRHSLVCTIFASTLGRCGCIALRWEVMVTAADWENFPSAPSQSLELYRLTTAPARIDLRIVLLHFPHSFLFLLSYCWFEACSSVHSTSSVCLALSSIPL